jgi:flavin-dependent dehydrogenase
VTQSAPSDACDVLVVGGGPAGSTAAALLGERGIDVVMLEKDAHPRFHIGESLLPRNLQILDRLGVHAEIATLGVYKPGAEFVSDETGQSVAYPFARSLNPAFTHAYQVRRSEFDSVLFANAKARGARVAEHTRVTDIVFSTPPGGRADVTASGADGTVRRFAPRFVLDASGRDTFIAGKLRTKRSNKHINNTAVFAHYHGVAARTDETEGYISVHLVENGWFWMIPLTSGVMSVGFVGNPAAYHRRGTSMEQFFDERLRSSPTVNARMAGAERISEVHATGNFSYAARDAWGEGWLLIGDAFAFLDPLFSSGVLLAMTAGELGADAASAWLRDPEAGRQAARRAERLLRKSMNNLSWLIYRINDPVLRDMFMAPSNVLRMRDGIVTMLAGNLAQEWRAVLPLLALKLTYYAFCVARGFGWQPLAPEGDGSKPAGCEPAEPFGPGSGKEPRPR